MYIIVGLGNPERKYAGTRHNIGFSAITAISDAYSISMDIKKHKAVCGKGMIAGNKVLLAMPQTYMNLSGESVRELVDFYKIDPEEELIIIMMISHWLRESFGYVPKEVPVDIMESRISLRIWGRSSFRGSGSAWERNRQAGIWRTMCWGDSRQRKSRRSVLRWSRR